MRLPHDINLSAALHDMIADQVLVVKRIAEASGVPSHTILQWKNGRAPKLNDFNMVLNTLGYRLVIDCYDTTKLNMFKRKGDLTPEQYKKYITIEYLLEKKCSFLTCAKAVNMTVKQVERLRDRGRKLGVK